MFRQKTFKTFLLLSILNQNGNIRLFSPRYRIMEEENDKGGGGGGEEKDKDGNPIYKKDFVEKLLTEKNNFKKAKEAADAELADLKKKVAEGNKGGNEGGDDKSKELLKAKDEELKKATDKAAKLEKEKTDAMKLGSLKMEFDKNGGKPKQWDLIVKLADVSKVIIDEDTNVVYGAEGEIKRIKDLAPDFFGTSKKTVEDGDTGGNNHLNEDNKDAGKALEGKRLQKDKKTGENPMVAYYAAQGLTVSKTRS